MKRHKDASILERHESIDPTSEISFETQYASNSSLSHRKSLGQFFTPQELSASMAEWVCSINPIEVLDPAVGTGILLKAIENLLPNSHLTGWDIDASPLEYAKINLAEGANTTLIHGDFLESSFHKKYDAIVANPPYIRHHNLGYDFERFSFLTEELGNIPKTANLYVLFIGAILRSLSDGGRASILVPSDWLNSNFGIPLKSAIQRLGILRRIVYFPNDTMPFSDNLSTAVILFLENTNSNSPVELISIDSSHSSNVLSTLGSSKIHPEISSSLRMIKIEDLDPKEKWSSIFEGNTSVAQEGWIPLGDISKTKRGIATGANDYFLISALSLKSSGLNKRRSRKCVGRAKDVKGIIFSEENFSQLEKSDAPTRLLDLDSDFVEDSKYIEIGIQRELPSRFLLANRKPWYSQEIRKPAPIWVGVFGREGIRFIWNKAGVSNLTTFHCLYPELSDNECGALVAMLNSSLLQKWNSRTERSYGGGLQKVEPRDILQMYIPNPKLLSSAVLDQLLASLEDSDALHKGGSPNWRMPIDNVMELTQLKK